MDAKTYLKRARQAERQVMATMERRRRLSEMARWRGPGGPGQLEALGRELDRRIDEYAALVVEVEQTIDGVEEPLYRDLLRFRYLNGWGWQTISAQTGYSRDWLMRLHSRALAALETSMAGEGTGNEEIGGRK